jgi:2-beta-glucuronyltransferase
MATANDATAMTASGHSAAPVALLFTQHLVGHGTRKGGLVFWAESLARLGWDTYAVTVQLSLLSRLARVGRLDTVPEQDINVWRERGERLQSFVWMAPLHPARVGNNLADRLTGLFAHLYPRFLPEAVRRVAERADLIVIETSAALALFDVLKRIAPAARMVYCHSDRLEVVGMHPVLSRILAQTAARYDLCRVHAHDLLRDFPPSARAMFISQGLDKQLFENEGPSPYPEGSRNVVVAGDMLFDRAAVMGLVEAFPSLRFHAFGRMRFADGERRPNLVQHGEVPFETMIPFLRNADVGLAPYVDRPDAHYLAESGLKLIQYTYCRLPTVAPDFAVAGRAHIMGYATGDPRSAAAAMARALAFDRTTIDRSTVVEWTEVMGRVLTSVGLGERVRC